MTGTITGQLSLAGPEPDRAGLVGGMSRDRTIVSGRLCLTTGGAATAAEAGGLVVAFIGGLPAADGGATARALAEAWPRSGDRCLHGVPGEWLVVVWDSRSGRLACARSNGGLVRLAWCADRRSLRFATRLADLLTDRGTARRLDESFLGDMLVNCVTSDRETPFLGVERLPAGHLLEVTPGAEPRVLRWYEATITPLAIDRDAAAAELRRRLDAVLADHVPPDGAGILVSGGIDSNAVLALARRAGSGRRRVAACSLVFPGQPHDESSWLDLVDRHSGQAVQRLVARDYDWPAWRAWTAESLLPPLRPNAATSDAAVALFAESGVRCVLTGEGGDDWFGAGPVHWPALVSGGRIGQVWRAARRVCPGLRPAAGMLWRGGVAPLLPAVRRARVPAWIAPAFAARIRLDERLRAARDVPRRAVRDPVAARVARVGHAHRIWQGEGVRDRFAGYGVDWLHPLHDQRVVDLVLRLPGEVLWRPGESKSLLRAAVADVVPGEIVRRQTKTSFSGPVAAAIRSAGGVRLLDGHPLVTEGYVDLPAVRALEHAAFARHDARLPPRHAGESLASLWAVLSTAVWFSAARPS